MRRDAPLSAHKYCRSEKKKLMEKEKSGNFVLLWADSRKFLKEKCNAVQMLGICSGNF